MTHVALEGRVFVLTACQAIRLDEYPDSYQEEVGGDPGAYLMRGGSAIVAPDGTVLAGPAFDQETIPTIPPNQQVTVTATITPTGEAVTGDYQVTLTATAPGANDTNAATADLAMTFTVETSPIWLLAGVVLIVAILAGLFYVFRTYGRR